MPLTREQSTPSYIPKICEFDLIPCLDSMFSPNGVLSFIFELPIEWLTLPEAIERFSKTRHHCCTTLLRFPSLPFFPPYSSLSVLINLPRSRLANIPMRSSPTDGLPSSFRVCSFLSQGPIAWDQKFDHNPYLGFSSTVFGTIALICLPL